MPRTLQEMHLRARQKEERWQKKNMKKWIRTIRELSLIGPVSVRFAGSLRFYPSRGCAGHVLSERPIRPEEIGKYEQDEDSMV